MRVSGYGRGFWICVAGHPRHSSAAPGNTFGCPGDLRGRTRLLGRQLLRQPIQAALDQPSVLVIAKRADPSLRTLEVLPGAAEITELAIALSQVEVQRRIQARHGQRDPSLRHPIVGEQVGRRYGSLIPEQLLVDIVLYISHRVREHANVQGIPLLAADLLPDLRKKW